MGVFSFFTSQLGRKGGAPATGKLVLGRSMSGHGEQLTVTDSVLRNHVYISGRHGFGKDSLVEQLLTQQTELGRGWIHIDPKADETMLNRLAAQARKNGREDEFLVLDLDTPANSHSYDVLRSGTAQDRATRVLQVLPHAGDSKGAQYYRTRAYDFLVPLFNAIDATGKSVGLRELALLLHRLGEEGVQREFLDAIPVAHEARPAFLAAMESATHNTNDLKTVLGGLSGRLYLLSTLRVWPLLNTEDPEIVMSDVLAHNKMLFVRLPVMMESDIDSVAATIARMVVQDVLTSMTYRTSLPNRLAEPFLLSVDTCVIDAHDAGLPSPVGVNAYSRARAMRVSFVQLGNSFRDLAKRYGDVSCDSLFGNTFTKVYFNQTQDEWLTRMQPELRAATLESLSLGEFMLISGAERHRGLLANNPSELPDGSYSRRAMAKANGRPRLALAGLAVEVAA